MCCAPYHRGDGEPDRSSKLVRARYSAFALGEIEFLYRTLHSAHPDRKHPVENAKHALRTASSAFKYMGLTLMDEDKEDTHGVARVLYLARIFRKGTDVSFMELAEFMADGGAPRYLSGKTFDATGLKAPPPSLRIDGFDAYKDAVDRRTR